MRPGRQRLKYLASDAAAAALSYFAFFWFRKTYIESEVFGQLVVTIYDTDFAMKLTAIVTFWLSLYTVSGQYRSIYRRSRLNEFLQTLGLSIAGCVALFFLIVLDDVVVNYISYYQSFLVLFGTHFLLTAVGRFWLSSITAHRIHTRQIGFNTLMIGSNENALKLYRELDGQKKSSGFLFKGFVHINGGKNHALEGHLPHLGHVDYVVDVIKAHRIDDAIIALESSEHDKIGQILQAMDGLEVNIKVIPKLYDILIGQVRMSSILGAPLIDINREIMPTWQRHTKRVGDVVLSLVALTVLSPVFLALAVLVKLSSPGPVFYSHHRAGLHGKPFRIIKFRTMVADAEKNGPALSSEGDTRITALGKVLRRTRLDELPQFFNVVRGEMSIVGPRPERQFYIDQIVQRAPHYKYLQKVRPGITSWGQVKFGYAENVDEMIERLRFDLLYIENMSLLVDLKILIHTVLIVLQGRGK